jgi:hypothetical protein
MDITDHTALIHVAHTSSSLTQLPPSITFNTSCLPHEQTKKPLSHRKRAKFQRMYDIILSTPQGPHSKNELPFHPSFNAEQKESRFLEDITQDISNVRPACIEQPDEDISPPTLEVVPVSSLLQTLGSKQLCGRIIDRPRREVPARKKSIREIEHVEWVENVGGEEDAESGWGTDSPAVLGEETLQDLGIVVSNCQLSWEEQRAERKRPHRCYTPSSLRVSWSYGTYEASQIPEWCG